MATKATMDQLKRAIREVMAHTTSRAAAEIAQVSENTLCRILRGENVSVRTAARIAEALGYRLTISVEKAQDIAVEP